MDDDQLRARLYDKEDGWTERKSKGVSRQDLARTIIAFANSLSDGSQGVLFIGIRDSDGIVEGVDETDKRQKEIRRIASERIYPPIHLGHNCRVIKEDGKDVIAVIVEASQKRPHFAGPSYVRIGSESVEASYKQFEQLIASRSSIARRILDAMTRDETILVEEDRSHRIHHRAQCKVVECNPDFATFRSQSDTYSAPLSQITASYEGVMNMTLFTLRD